MEFYGGRIGCDKRADDDEIACSLLSRVDQSAGQAPASERASALTATTRGLPKKGSGRKSRARLSKPINDSTQTSHKATDTDADDTENMTDVGLFTRMPTVPAPAFIAAAIMEA